MSTELHIEQHKDGSDLLKGFAAGAIGGLLATAAKTLGEKAYPPRTHGEPEPPDAAAEKLAGHPLEAGNKLLASEGLHWIFGVAAGGFYGVMAELYPAVTAKNGASFGMLLMTVTHEGALPALGLGQPKEDQTLRERTSEAATHLMYGFVTERVRSAVRKLLH